MSGNNIKFFFIIFCSVVFGSCQAQVDSKKINSGFNKSELIVGVHYYSWFPENWNAGIFGDYLEPKLWPALGKYNSGDDAVVKQHVKWMENAGINLIVFDWWVQRRDLKKKIKKTISLLDGQKSLRFAIHYESLDLKKIKDPADVLEKSNEIFLTKQRIDALKLHILDIVEDYASNKNYFLIEGKPVIFLYATRHLVGPVPSAIKEVREFIKQKTGKELYLIADEVYIQVLDYHKDKGIYVKDPYQVNLARMLAFDAITSYNPYDGRKTEHAGVEGVENYLRDTEKLYQVYRQVAEKNNLTFIPTALPGYNDRGVRLSEDHFILSRETSKADRSFFQLNLEQLVKPFIEQKTPIFMVTSWNEWNEGSQIEPSVEFSQHAKDISANNNYIGNENYSGYGLKYLNELEQFIAGIGDN